MADTTADTAAAMLKALRAAELSGKPLAIGLANALHELLEQHMQPVRIAGKGEHSVVLFTDIALIITYLCCDKHA